MSMTIHPTVLHHMIVSSRQLHADLLLSMEAEQLIERHIRRNIQYRWILRLILRQNTVPLCTERPPAEEMTPRDRDGSLTHTHGVMHLFPTSVKKVHGGMARFLRKPCFLFPMYQKY